MTEADSRQRDLLAAILAAPEDDTLRLLYADWLKGNPDTSLSALSRLIRVQVSAARLATNDPRRKTLKNQANELRDKHGRQWEAPVLAAGATKIHYERGMAEVTLPLSSFLEHSHALFGSPVLAGIEAVLTGLKTESAATRLATIQALAGYPQLAGLTSLNLEGNGLGFGGGAGAAVRAMATCGHLSHLISLNLGGNGLGYQGQADAALKALASCRNLSHLTSLNLGGNGLGYQGQGEAALTALAKCGNLSRLTSLDLADNAVGHGGHAEAALRALGQCQQFTSLQALDLRHNRIATLVEVRLLCDAIRRHVFPAIKCVQIGDTRNHVAQVAVNEAIRQHRSGKHA